MTYEKIQQKCENVMELLTDVVPTEIHARVQAYVILTGGAIPSWLQGETPKDYDIFFNNKHSVKLVMSRYIPMLSKLLQYKVEVVEYIDSRGIPAFRFNIQGLKVLPKSEDNIYDIKSVSANAISFRNGIQLITRFYGDVAQIHSTFDFEHLKNYYTEGLLTLDPKTMLLAQDKKLVYTGSEYPISAMFRTEKLKAREYTISKQQLAKILIDIAILDLTDPKVLEDQLGGVYLVGTEELNQVLKLHAIASNPKHVAERLKSALSQRDVQLNFM